MVAPRRRTKPSHYCAAATGAPSSWHGGGLSSRTGAGPGSNSAGPTLIPLNVTTSRKRKRKKPASNIEEI